MQFPFRIIETNDFDVLGFGTNAVDYLIRVPEYPVFNSKLELTEYTESPGGEVASSMVGLARLGLRTAYSGRFGGDPAGEIGLRSLTEAGVDTTYSETILDARTQIAFIIIDERSGERTVLWQRDNKLAYTASDAPIGAVDRTRLLHVTPHDTAACIEMARAARKAGVIVSIDIDNIFEGIEKLLPLVDVCIVSEDFAETFLGIAENESALKEISSRFGCAITGLTLGEEGSLFFCQDRFIETKGFKVSGGCADTTGAGDAFRTGFLFGMLTGQSVEESALSANAVASLKCRGFGARSALPDLTELLALLQKS